MQPAWPWIVLSSVALAACSANVDVFDDDGSGGSVTTGGAGPGPGPSGSTTGPGPVTSTSTGSSMATSTASTGSSMPCEMGPDDDADGDAFTENQGDCNDCDPLVGPNSIEILGNAADEDCDGSTTNTLQPCDALLAIDDQDPFNAARAIELCKISMSPTDWGLTNAAWMQIDGTPPPAMMLADFHLGHGILDGFGAVVEPRAGARLLALSNGNARDDDDPDYEDPQDGGKGYSSSFPPGFPKPASGCTTGPVTTAHDSIGLELTLRVPANVNGFSFVSDFYSHDWPAFVCSTYDDGFIALLSPIPPNLPDGGIAFYPNGDPVSLNGTPFEVCSCMGGPPCMAGGKSYTCALGDARLAGTGYEQHAASGYQITTAPVPAGGTITIRLGVYDATDPIIAATTLLDAWTWITAPNVPTQTVPAP
jgi:hypothetical protein